MLVTKSILLPNMQVRRHPIAIRKVIALLLLLAPSLAIGAETPTPSGLNRSLSSVDLMDRALNGSCRYPIMEKNQRDEKLTCALNALRNRCNEIDDCYVYCLGNDVGVNVGGGCEHLCNYGLRKPWSPPKGIEACTRNSK